MEQGPGDKRPTLRRSGGTAFHTEDIAKQRTLLRNEPGETLGQNGVQSSQRRRR